ncbi:MAG: hypothetical protein JEZ07_00600 [Phycisphaerae bacterium]|nr:hypothetical protein [Phycisphaerae bacterium]
MARRSIGKHCSVAFDLFEGKLTQEQIIEKYKLKPGQLERVMNSKSFNREIACLCRKAQLETRVKIARYGPIAAETLVGLLNSDKPDVARRAALDMIERCNDDNQEKEKEDNDYGIADKDLKPILVKLAKAFG